MALCSFKKSHNHLVRNFTRGVVATSIQSQDYFQLFLSLLLRARVFIFEELQNNQLTTD